MFLKVFYATYDPNINKREQVSVVSREEQNQKKMAMSVNIIMNKVKKLQ